MPVTRELSIVYGGFTVGGSTARQLTEYVLHEEDYESGYVEFEFVTTAASASAFATEIIDVRDAFRDPRNNLTITQESQTILSRSHSANTGFDTYPRVVKDGDPADTGRSRHFRVRIDYGIPADNVGTNFRRWSTVNVEYDAARRRTVTVSGTYTANSSDGTTGSFAQYRAQISAYLLTVVNAVDSAATWETIGEPTVERNETDKVTTFSIVAREILDDQSSALLNDDDIVDPTIEIEVHRLRPGDSDSGGFSFGGGGTGGQEFVVVTGTGPAGSTGTMQFTPGSSTPGTTTTQERPRLITITYQCSIDQSRTKNLRGKWANSIRPLLIARAAAFAEGAVVLLEEKPLYNTYANTFRASMNFISYVAGKVLHQRIFFEDHLQFGRVLVAVATSDAYDYYEYPGPAVRLAITTAELEVKTSKTSPNDIVAELTPTLNASVSGLADGQNWMPVSNRPKAAIIKQGLPGADEANVALITVERVAQFRRKKSPSVANVGGVTGTTITTTG